MMSLQRTRLFLCLIGGSLLSSASLLTQATSLDEANQLFKKAQYSAALDKVNEVLTKQPNDAQARFLKGLVLTQQNKTDGAIKIFTALTNDYPELPEPYNNLAVLYANQGQYDKARQALELAIRTHPSYATAHENLGDIYAKMASQAYDRALKLDHGNSATQTKLAMIQDLFGASPNKPSNQEVTPPSASANPATPKPSVASAPTEIPPTAAVVTPPAADASQDVLKTLHDWAAAWSAKNANKYLAHYADNFKTPNGSSRADWAAERKERIAKPKTIYVAISNPSVKFSDANHAVAEFHQSYHASHLKTTSTKILFMEKSGGKWLILEERVK